MKTTQTILDQILIDVRKELAAAQSCRSLAELKAQIADTPLIRPLPTALRTGFGLIAEIKERSPSHGPMRRQNVDEAPQAYEHSPVVRAISVLTNASHFGMSMDRLRRVKQATTKPVLRKDFIFDEYQVYEARAFGADAILLMANLLDTAEMQRLYALARDLDMDALFECHTREQIEQVPSNATVYGINSRTFDSRKNTLGVGRYAVSSLLGRLGSSKDLTVDVNRFELGQHLPPSAIKVAESGVRPDTVANLRDELGYHAALVGTSLLTAPEGIWTALDQFNRALVGPGQVAAGEHPATSSVRKAQPL
jgi:indole-3-glycerol phosphate synthase